MSKGLRITFLIHALLSTVGGLLLLIIPGRTLLLLGWAPIDPLLSRVLGAALLALAWSSFRGRRATEWGQVRILVELEAVFCTLACVGLLRHLMGFNWPLMVWLLCGIFLAMAVVWIASLVRRP